MKREGAEKNWNNNNNNKRLKGNDNRLNFSQFKTYGKYHGGEC